MTTKQTELIGHYCPKCNMIVAYRTPMAEVYCSCCQTKAVPDARFKDPKPRYKNNGIKKEVI